MKKKPEEYVPVTLTQEEAEVLVDACSLARDKLCERARWECSRCKNMKRCELVSELELKLQGL